MNMTVNKDNLEHAYNEIERNEADSVPLEQRGGEVLEEVNDVFNLMAIKIKQHADARQQTAEQFGNETRKFKTRPNVIYMKGPRDRLLMMTETNDQSLKLLPRDPRGLFGARFPMNQEKVNQKQVKDQEIKVVDQNDTSSAKQLEEKEEITFQEP